MLTLFVDFRSAPFGRSNGHIPFRTFFLLTSVRAAVSHIVPPPFFFSRVTGLSRSPPEEPGISDVNLSDRSLYRCRKIGRRDSTIGNCTIAAPGYEGRGFDRGVPDHTETGNISVTYGLNDGKIRSPAGMGYSPDVVRFSRDVDSLPESPRAVADIGSMTRGRSGGTEPLGSLVAEEQEYGAGNQSRVETEEGNAREDGKGGVESRFQTLSNIAYWSTNHNASGSNSDLPSVVSRPQGDRCEGTQFRFTM